MSISTISASAFVQQQFAHGSDSCVLDVRTVPELKTSHLAGSINIPLQGLTPERLTEKLARCEKAPETLYLLCQGGKRAQAAAELLDGKVHANLCVIEGGINGLRAANAPLIESKGSGMAIERQVRIAAGALVLLGILLSMVIAPAFLALSAFVGAGLVVAGITDSCMMGLILARMPWNK